MKRFIMAAALAVTTCTANAEQILMLPIDGWHDWRKIAHMGENDMKAVRAISDAIDVHVNWQGFTPHETDQATTLSVTCVPEEDGYVGLGIEPRQLVMWRIDGKPTDLGTVAVQVDDNSAFSCLTRRSPDGRMLEVGACAYNGSDIDEDLNPLYDMMKAGNRMKIGIPSVVVKGSTPASFTFSNDIATFSLNGFTKMAGGLLDNCGGLKE